MRQTVITRMFPLQISFAVFASTHSAHVTAGQKPQAGDVHELTSAQVVEREMSGAEAHSYKVTLKAAEFLQVRVEQKGVDVLLRLFDASGVEMARMDSPNGKVGPEILSFVATTAGSYTLEVSGLDKKAEKGAYTVGRTEPRAATARDRRRVEVERAFAEGMTARDTAGQQATALVKLREALTGWRELSDEYLLQLTQRQVRALKLAGRNAKAKAVFAEARKLAEEGTAESKREALARFERSRGLYREIGDEVGQADCLVRLGFIYNSLGEPQKALDFYNQELPLRRAVSDRAGEATTLNNMGLVYSTLGEQQKALDFYNQSLPLRRAVGDRAGEAIVLINIGAAYSNLGEKQKALEQWQRMLQTGQTLISAIQTDLRLTHRHKAISFPVRLAERVPHRDRGLRFTQGRRKGIKPAGSALTKCLNGFGQHFFSRDALLVPRTSGWFDSRRELEATAFLPLWGGDYNHYLLARFSNYRSGFTPVPRTVIANAELLMRMGRGQQ